MSETLYKVTPFDDGTWKGDLPLPDGTKPFVIGAVASRCSGKTSLILSMLLNKNAWRYKFDELYWCSPTAISDEKVVNVLSSNKILKHELKPKKKSKRRQNEWGEIEEEEEDPAPVIITDNFLDAMVNLLKLAKEDPKKKRLVIFDDLACYSTILKSKELLNLVFNSRHYAISMVITAQTYTSLSKPIRLNLGYLMLWKTGNRREVQQNLYPENHCGYTWEDWSAMYDFATKEPFSFMTIDHNAKNRKRQMTASLKQYLFMSND